MITGTVCRTEWIVDHGCRAVCAVGVDDDGLAFLEAGCIARAHDGASGEISHVKSYSNQPTSYVANGSRVGKVGAKFRTIDCVVFFDRGVRVGDLVTFEPRSFVPETTKALQPITETAAQQVQHTLDLMLKNL